MGRSWLTPSSPLSGFDQRAIKELRKLGKQAQREIVASLDLQGWRRYVRRCFSRSDDVMEPVYSAVRSIGFHTFSNPNPSKSFTLAVANLVTPKARRARAVRVS